MFVEFSVPKSFALILEKKILIGLLIFLNDSQIHGWSN